jgi:hypothetical protein
LITRCSQSTIRGNFRLGEGSPTIHACINGMTDDLDNINRPKNGDGIPGGEDFDLGAWVGMGVVGSYAVNYYYYAVTEDCDGATFTANHVAEFDFDIVAGTP